MSAKTSAMLSLLRNTVALLLATSASAEESTVPTPALLKSDQLFELVQDDVDVSGNVVVGVMTHSAMSAVAQGALIVQSLQGAEQDVCLSAFSRNGIYFSKNEFSLPDARLISLPYTSSKQDPLYTYEHTELAFAAQTGECDSNSGTYLVVTGDAQLEEPIYLYVNSFGATDVFLNLADDESIVYTCDFIVEGRRTTFDYSCRIDAKHVNGATDFVLGRERFGRAMPDIELVIVQP